MKVVINMKREYFMYRLFLCMFKLWKPSYGQNAAVVVIVSLAQSPCRFLQLLKSLISNTSNFPSKYGLMANYMIF